ncbi:MAG: IPT/TIG domain-containing protein [Bacteroidetes bacterium]|nr:IPT/TIG domain-containing protein [Bacteroidota bacterium]
MTLIVRSAAVLLFLTLLFTAGLSAQNGEVDIIYLKNGKTVVGTIVEKIEGKTVVIETKEGTELIDYADIKEMVKEFVPSVSGLAPMNANAGASVVIYGSFPASRPAKSSVTFGGVEATITQWRKDKITVTVPALGSGQHEVVVTIGGQQGAAEDRFTLSGGSTQQQQMLQQRNRKMEEKQSEPVQEEFAPSGNQLDGFWFNVSMAKAAGVFGAVEGDEAGFAKNGYSYGFEVRAKVEENLFVPVGFQFATNELNLDELNKNNPGAFTSDDETYLHMWITLGLGVALNFSPETYLFASADAGLMVAHRPDLEAKIIDFKVESADAFTGGYGYSVGLVAGNSFSFGMKYFTATPTYTISSSIGGNSAEEELDQKTNLMLLFVAINFD